MFALSQCLLCQIYFGLRVEQFCPSAKAAQPQVREIKLHIWLLIRLISYYWIRGTNTNAKHSVSRILFATVFKQTQNVSEVLKQIMT